MKPAEVKDPFARVRALPRLRAARRLGALRGGEGLPVIRPGLVALAALLGTSPAMARCTVGTPWVVYSQTSIAAGSSIDNPAPNVNGLVGEVATLPYTVPAGYDLDLETWGVEAYNVANTIVLFPWIGPPPASNPASLPSAGSWAGTRQLAGNFRLPAGKVLNFRLQNAQVTAVVAWFASGCLVAQ